MASWNSIQLEITYRVLGWMGFACWSVGGYPQVILNFRRKSSAVQKQYWEKYGYGQMIPVAVNDVAFSAHAVLLTAFVLFQIAIYERGTQKVSKIAIGIVVAVWSGAAVCVFVALPTHSWLWLINIFNSIQVCMTVVKYTPQAFLNFVRKSTDGFSLGSYLLDFSGGVTNYAQMTVLAIDQDSWVNFYGNMGKVLLSLISIFFDLVFMCQRFLLYPSKKAPISPPPPQIISKDKESLEPLLQSSSDHPLKHTV
ncbi:cystinosin homolog isoform X2 [Prunus dulcis]|uniref:cystinosin homolog isoform X2 n=1 Tax=Prunus dulcis TaxID=3755 RepID=UPI001481E9A7|nr:cystinosin homolog isoform X2 [Prunus dulcis]